MSGLVFNSTKIIFQETMVILHYPDYLHIGVKMSRLQFFQTSPLLVKTATQHAV